MKSRVELPVAFLRGARNILLASMLAVPVVGSASVNTATWTMTRANAFVNVTGKVKDQQGNPIIGATVLVKGTKSGVQTDKDGTFRINMPEGNSVIVVTYIGYKVQEVNMAGMTSVTITMEPTDAIDEVVVTGYGTQKRSEIVGAVATISGEELMDIPAPNIAGALRNKIAGVGVSQANGAPGARISLNIRGASMSEKGAGIGATTEPLYIIDGITVSSDVFDSLDPSMVDNITFLKDASAAIYGASGAKGVVLVTTKRGKAGKPSVSYNGYVGITDVARKPDMLSAVELAEFLNDGFHAGNQPESRFFSEADMNYLRGLDTKSWYDQLWKSAIMQRHNLSVSGGSERINFFVGGSYQREEGNYPGISQDKYSLRSGLTTTILEGLTADIAFNVNSSVRDDRNKGANNEAFKGLIGAPAWVPLEINGMLVHTSQLDNPLALFRSGYESTSKQSSYSINASLSYQPKFIPGFTAKVQVAQNGDNSSSQQYQPPYKLYDFVRMGNNGAFYSTSLVDSDPNYFEARTAAGASVNNSLARGSGYQAFATLSYANTFGKHSVDAVFGGQQTMDNHEDLGVRWDNQLLPGFQDYWAFDANRMVLNGRGIGKSTKRSFFGRVGYNFDQKYIVSFVGRYDASSNFATGNRWGLSPSVGAGWIVSKENFFAENLPFINYFKLKVNYGVTGDDRVQERLWQERYRLDIDNGYMFGDNNYGMGINPDVYPNLNITWEKKRTFNFGVEGAVLDNKLNFGVEFFQNKVYDGFDQGANETNPLYSGLIAPVINYREAYNWGSEFTLGYNTSLGKDWGLSTSMNFGFGNSVVTKMIYAEGDFLVTDLSDGKWLGNRYGTDPHKYNTNNVGYRTNGMFRTQDQIDAFLAEHPNYTINGQTPQPGWLIYEDTNGDGVINSYDQTLLFDRTNPVFASGISIGLKYKDFKLNTNINAQFGGKAFFDTRARSKPDETLNVPAFWSDRWTIDNPMEGKYPRYDDPLAHVNSDFWAVNATMIRINNMTFSYTVPSDIVKRMGMGSLSVLLTGNNLWTLVNPFSYKDPYSSGIYDYPTVRTISVGLRASL